MINSLLRALIALFLPALVVNSAMGQTSPTAEEILAAWMSSQHANAESEAFRHWDSEGEIPGNCAVCHSSTGFVDYVSAPQSKPALLDHPVPTGTTVECATCHNPASEALKDVIFPGGTTIDMSSGTPVCAVCHQGRTSKGDVDKVVADIGEDDVSDQLAFVNIHYSAAATTQQGSAVGGGYEYEGLSYAGPFGHVPGFSSCASCHDAHATVVKLENCSTCHAGVTDFQAIRTTPLDILADGNTGMGIAGVIDQLHDRLEAAILTYARENVGTAIVYSKSAYPYFFNDTNGNGTADADEATFPNRYQSWTPRLLKAAYNYQFVAKDGGAFAHNPHYAIQLLIDSTADLAEVAEVESAAVVRP